MMFLLATLALAAPIDLDAALKLVIGAGFDTQEAALARRGAESALTRSRLAGLPNLNASASVGAWGGSSFGTTADLGLASTTTLYAGGALHAERDRALASVNAALVDEQRVLQDLELALAVNLLGVAAAHQRVASAGAALEAETALEGRITALVAAGARTRADLLQQTAAVAKARLAMVNAQRDHDHAQLDLVEVLRLDPRKDWEFIAPETPEAPDLPLDAFVAMALEQLPEIAVIRARLLSAEAALRGAGATGRPSVDLRLSASTEVAAGNAPAFDGQASVQLEVPIFNRGVTRHDVTQAKIELEAAQLDLAAVEESAGLGVRRALTDREAAGAAEVASGTLFTASEAAARVVQDRYEAGAAVLAELLAARAELREAEGALIEARADRVAAEFTLLWSVGGLGRR